MTSLLERDRDVLSFALAQGNLNTIQAFFAQPHVHDHVLETNQRLLEPVSLDLLSFQSPDGHVPWFYDYENRPRFVLQSAALNGHLHVLEWFFDREQAQWMGETLKRLLPMLGDLFYTSHGDPMMLEILVSSYVFTNLIPDDKQQEFIDTIANQCNTALVIDVAIAHGARLNTPQALRLYYGLETLQTTYQFLVGGDVRIRPPQCWVYAQINDSFVSSGEYLEARITDTLRDEAVGFSKHSLLNLLTDGFLDIDGSDASGKTALMHAVSTPMEPDFYPGVVDVAMEAIQILFDLGDVNAVDHEGRTALHYAIEHNREAVNWLLNYGANPTICDHNGVQVLDLLDICDWLDTPWIVFMWFEKSPNPQSLYDRLINREDGQVFVHDHRSEFERLGYRPRSVDVLSTSL